MTWPAIPIRFTAVDAIDIVATSILTYYLLLLIRGTRAVQIMLGLFVLVVILAVSNLLHLLVLATVMQYLLLGTAVGLPIEKCQQLNRGMAVLRSVIAYLRPAVLGDTIRVATWLLPTDGKLRVRRRFQVRREADGATLARAEIEYACIELSSGRPARWPPEFRERYECLDAVVRASEILAPV